MGRREGGTEMPYTGKFLDQGENGVYYCILCENILFTSLSKINSIGGFPCFKEAFSKDALELTTENAGAKSEAHCGKCKSHHGYLFGKITDDDQYFQVNSLALGFKEIKLEKKEEKEGEKKEETSSTQNNTAVIQTVAITVGGAVVGAVIAGTLVYFSIPAPSCDVPATEQTITPTTTPTSNNTNPVTRPAPTQTPATGNESGTPTASQPATTPETPTNPDVQPTTGTGTGAETTPPDTPADTGTGSGTPLQ